MSKFLKFIVNLFLIGAILIGAAILVPPLAGISTTVIDSSSMTTNLPVGSVTYAKDVDVTEIEAGDKVLDDSDGKIYLYVIEEGSAGTGRFLGTDANSASGEQKELVLRNDVSKVIITVPFIGYIMMAMHSVEGLIIIGLVVLFIIILFILSELWKKPDEDEDEEEEDEEEGKDKEKESTKAAEASKPEKTEPEEGTPNAMTEEEALALAKDELMRVLAEDQDGEKAAPAEAEVPASEQDITEELISQEEKAEEVTEVQMEETEPEEQFAELPEEEVIDEDPSSFVPVTRMSREELLKKAEAAGEEPVVTKDEELGVTILDYSKLI